MAKFSLTARSGETSAQKREGGGPPSKPKQARTSQSERRQKAMTLILDTAEALFAESGYNGVTLNEVAHAAGVDTSLMRYYYGDKEQLFQAVFRRRGPEINELRLEAMSQYREAA